ncbi:MAG TPA: GH116 family glycosyl-hydrolase [Candidatus Acidoferrum sp.]|nr:GH116 family glycosyl-hydrolase [Candidatus Acidoferrum sp.]
MRKCNCSGNCGPQSLSRREFIGLVGAGTAATLLATPAWGAFELPADEMQQWRKSLFATAKPRLYLSDKHTDARMHLGGIGTGNFEIGADGQFTTWQLFNTLRDGHLPFYFLARAGAVSRLLQTAGGPDWPRVKQIEMSGEYPVAVLRYRDPHLPVNLELSAFSPFAPLDSAFSSLPVAAFAFRIENPSAQPQTVSLAALMQNPLGYDAAGDNNSAAGPAFGGNINEVLNEQGATGLYMRAQAAGEPTLDQAVTLFTAANLKALNDPPADRPENLRLRILDGAALPPTQPPDSAPAILWIEEPPATLAEPFLRAARDAVQAGATLLFSGRTMPLLEAYAAWTGGKPVAEANPRPDVLFEDFEHGYEQWKVEGQAFGKQPAHGTLPNQQPVSGFVGQGLVNTYLGGDDTTGRLISKDFTIGRRFMRFLVGGGHHQGTQIRLLVNGKVARAASGKDNERLEPVCWDVAQFEGQTAHLEIVDEAKGGWGHINVDQIEFSDMPGNRAVMALLEELLPARFSAVHPAHRNADIPVRNSAAEGEADRNVRAPTQSPAQRVTYENLVLQPGATQITSPEGRTLLTRQVGKGRVVVADGAVLEPANAALSAHRQLAYAFVCGLVGANYAGSGGLQHPKAPGFGTLALAALAGKTTVLPACEHRDQAWTTFSAKGGFTPPENAQATVPTPLGRTVYGAVATSVTVPPAGTVEVPFLLTWHYPNKYNAHHTWMGCHYATRWPDARAVLREAAPDFAHLRDRTEQFRRTFYDSTLPWWLLDCVSANAAIARHIGVVFRIANGDAYGWEGSNGCCDPTCTHVWGYEQTLARFFPDLEREMRRIDFMHQQDKDGGINNRTQVPSPPHPTGEHPFADGHASCILKAYREALNQPDEPFFQQYWPYVHRAVDYLIGRDARTNHSEPAGILQDDQWNTYDEALHGVTTFISGYYLAALRAGEEWARRQGDTATAERFHAIFQKGQAKLIELCWNQEYFQQHLPDYEKRQGEVGPGCMADQLIGQWWAHQLGLGYILPQEMVASSLRSIFKYNFKSDLTGWPHAPRAFAGAKDKGLIVCTWPKGGRPRQVMLYSDEVWTGIEYQVAAHMIYEGLIEEGFAIIKAARDRYDGIPRPPIQRNPWNEIECGGHYARAMSSGSLLPALAGWDYDGPRQALRFVPRHTPERFKCFFSAPAAWGSASQSRQGGGQQNEISVCEGSLAISKLALQGVTVPRQLEVQCAGKAVPCSYEYTQGLVAILLQQPALIPAGQSLVVRIA